MTKAEAVTFLGSIVPQPVTMITVDAAQWEAFKVVVLAALAAAPADPKFETALKAANIKLDEANAIVDEALK